MLTRPLLMMVTDRHRPRGTAGDPSASTSWAAPRRGRQRGAAVSTMIQVRERGLEDRALLALTATFDTQSPARRTGGGQRSHRRGAGGRRGWRASARHGGGLRARAPIVPGVFSSDDRCTALPRPSRRAGWRLRLPGFRHCVRDREQAGRSRASRDRRARPRLRRGRAAGDRDWRDRAGRARDVANAGAAGHCGNRPVRRRRRARAPRGRARSRSPSQQR